MKINAIQQKIQAEAKVEELQDEVFESRVSPIIGQV